MAKCVVFHEHLFEWDWALPPIRCDRRRDDSSDSALAADEQLFHDLDITGR
jgi:hypothetical protein